MVLLVVTPAFALENDTYEWLVKPTEMRRAGPLDPLEFNRIKATGNDSEPLFAAGKAQALIDATVRLIPRVLGNQASTEEESFSEGLLEFPHYTRPTDWQGRAIPEVLLSGHHANIATWRRTMAERLTKERRPDLWRAYCAQHGRNPNEDQEQ